MHELKEEFTEIFDNFGFRNVNNFKNRALLFWHLTNSLA